MGADLNAVTMHLPLFFFLLGISFQSSLSQDISLLTEPGEAYRAASCVIRNRQILHPSNKETGLETVS
jgi:hypothetical protein